MNQVLIRRLLQKAGCQVTIVADGRAAVEAVANARFDVIFMDVHTPQMDGIEATGPIRHLEAGTRRRIPIIALTASVVKGEREKCLAAGMDDYIAKPIVIEVLEATLARWADPGWGSGRLLPRRDTVHGLL